MHVNMSSSLGQRFTNALNKDFDENNQISLLNAQHHLCKMHGIFAGRIQKELEENDDAHSVKQYCQHKRSLKLCIFYTPLWRECLSHPALSQ